MQINLTLDSTDNVLELINSTNQGLLLTKGNVSVGAVSEYVPPSGVLNSQVTITALLDQGFKGSKVVKYRRLTIDEAAIEVPRNIIEILPEEDEEQTIQRIADAIGVLVSDISLSIIEIAQPSAPGTIEIDGIAGSLLYLEGAGREYLIRFPQLPLEEEVVVDELDGFMPGPADVSYSAFYRESEGGGWRTWEQGGATLPWAGDPIILEIELDSGISDIYVSGLYDNSALVGQTVGVDCVQWTGFKVAATGSGAPVLYEVTISPSYNGDGTTTYARVGDVGLGGDDTPAFYLESNNQNAKVGVGTVSAGGGRVVSLEEGVGDLYGSIGIIPHPEGTPPPTYCPVNCFFTAAQVLSQSFRRTEVEHPRCTSVEVQAAMVNGEDPSRLYFEFDFSMKNFSAGQGALMAAQLKDGVVLVTSTDFQEHSIPIGSLIVEEFPEEEYIAIRTPAEGIEVADVPVGDMWFGQIRMELGYQF